MKNGGSGCIGIVLFVCLIHFLLDIIMTLYIKSVHGLDKGLPPLVFPDMRGGRLYSNSPNTPVLWVQRQNIMCRSIWQHRVHLFNYWFYNFVSCIINNTIKYIYDTCLIMQCCQLDVVMLEELCLLCLLKFTQLGTSSKRQWIQSNKPQFTTCQYLQQTCYHQHVDMVSTPFLRAHLLK